MILRTRMFIFHEPQKRNRRIKDCLFTLSGIFRSIYSRAFLILFDIVLGYANHRWICSSNIMLEYELKPMWNSGANMNPTTHPRKVCNKNSREGKLNTIQTLLIAIEPEAHDTPYSHLSARELPPIYTPPIIMNKGAVYIKKSTLPRNLFLSIIKS